MMAVSEPKNAGRTTRYLSGTGHLGGEPFGDAASKDGQDALRLFSVERLVAYGVRQPEAMELRGRVWSGEDWRTVATDLAETCLSPPELSIAPQTVRTRADRLFRAAALLRMSQMLLQDGSERCSIYARAAKLYEEAAVLVGDRERLIFETPNGKLVGWRYPSLAMQAVGQAVVICGLDGWAMDLGDMALELSGRGIDTVVLDGPGQGESRMAHGHFLRVGWEASYSSVLDDLDRRDPRLRIGVVGNSMGGAIAVHLAARDPRISACCENCGPDLLGLERQDALSFLMTSQCGDVPQETAMEIWRTIKPLDPEFPGRCPLLVVHGARDPLITERTAERMFEAGLEQDKHLFVYDDGDHCVYNHSEDKHALIADWLVSRLSRHGV